MKSHTRLDSAAFQLTPTRTRCDLVITANGKSEKIASGLLNPFLSHLKTAQDQIAKGGYSIALNPDPGSDATWFTKGTLERFVRFVSTPEILERVNTIESEIIQIEEAITIQSNDNLGLHIVEDQQARSMERIEGSKPVFSADSEKAIVLYKPGAHPPESTGSTIQEENSKVQLLRVLETRRTVLQKEQGMAFARAVAAGFDMDLMEPLISFAECFGASRLMEACLRFMDLWKGKHETGQWLEFEAAEAMSSQSDVSSMNASGIMLSEPKKQREFQEAWPESHGELATDGKASNDASAGKKHSMDSQVPLGHHEFFQGQFQHPMFSQWPIHSPPGAPPVFQAYPMQGMPYYQNYPGNGPFFHPPYPPMEDPRFNVGQRMGQKRHSMDSKDSNIESENWEMGVSSTRTQDDLELEKEGSQGREPRKKDGRSGKKQSGRVVIRNINYITSKRQNTSGSESESASGTEADEEAGDLGANATDLENKYSMQSSRSKGSHKRSIDTRNLCDKDDTVNGQEADGGNWQAFQNFILRGDEDTRLVDRGMFGLEREAQVKRQQDTAGGDPIVPHRHNQGELQEGRTIEFDTISGRNTRMLKSSNDELVISGREFHLGDGRGARNGQMGVQFTEIEGGSGRYRGSANDDFMIYGRESQSGFTNSPSGPLAGNGFEHAPNSLDRMSKHNVSDESFIVPLRSSSQDQVGPDGRTVIDMDSELPSAVRKTEDMSSRIRSQLSYEPDDLSLMPERGTERESIGYDYAVDYEMQVHAEDAATLGTRNKDVVTGVKEESKKSDKDKKSSVKQGSSEKRKMEAAMRKGKLNPLAEAQARAERLRAHKADLQKLKKEKEEEEMKRLEALKRERQKRIAARGSLSPAQSPLPSQQTRPRLPTMVSPSSHKGSKFSDSEPGPLSPLQRLPIKISSVESRDIQKTTKPSRLNNGGHLAGNGLSRSVSSLPELKKESDSVTPEPKVATTRIRRLSDPKTSNSKHVSSVKLRSTDPVSKPKVSNGPEIKKISAIISLDRTKAATLPELKIRPSRGPSDMVQSKSATTKEITKKVNGSRTSVISESAYLNKSNEKISHHSDGDNYPVIDKTVVMLEREMTLVPVIHVSEERMDTRKGSYDEGKVGEKIDAVSEYANIRAPASPLTMGEVDRDPSIYQLEEQPSSHKLTTGYEKEESPKFSTIDIAEKPYPAPYARMSSLEHPCTKNLEYSKAPPTSLVTETSSTETAKAHVSDFTDLGSLEQIPEASEKPRGKDSSKGFRRLLKFGKKNHSSGAGERNVESDKLSVDGSVGDDNTTNAAAPNEVHTLKNLISQDETPTGSNTSQKASRSFSLLSPFRSKTAEKKLTT